MYKGKRKIFQIGFVTENRFEQCQNTQGQVVLDLSSTLIAITDAFFFCHRRLIWKGRNHMMYSVSLSENKLYFEK